VRFTTFRGSAAEAGEVWKRGHAGDQSGAVLIRSSAGSSRPRERNEAAGGPFWPKATLTSAPFQATKNRPAACSVIEGRAPKGVGFPSIALPAGCFLVRQIGAHLVANPVRAERPIEIVERHGRSLYATGSGDRGASDSSPSGSQSSAPQSSSRMSGASLTVVLPSLPISKSRRVSFVSASFPTASLRPALTVILCLAAIVLLWYGAGALFHHDPSADTGSLAEH
jgi:hypothetical protein